MKTLLAKKWIAPVILFCYVIFLSLWSVYKINPYLKEAYPIIKQEIVNFLPITIQNGEIIQPENVIIQKSYSFGDEATFNVVLDTRTDTVDINTIPQNSIYISKKCVYFVTPEKGEVSCFEPTDKTQPEVITKEMAVSSIDMAEKYIGTFLGVSLIFLLFIGFYIAILFYTVIMHWLLALLSKTSFGQTLFINTLIFTICNLLEATSPINFNFLIMVLLLFGVNLTINKYVLKEQTQNETE